MPKHPLDNIDRLDADAVADACETYMTLALTGKTTGQCMGAAIITYTQQVASKVDLKPGFVGSEMPLEVLYPDIHDRYIATQERTRAIGIISECLNAVAVEDLQDISELKLFLALVQGEIEGL